MEIYQNNKDAWFPACRKGFSTFVGLVSGLIPNLSTYIFNVKIKLFVALPGSGFGSAWIRMSLALWI
jgi:hypothetical protein